MIIIGIFTLLGVLLGFYLGKFDKINKIVKQKFDDFDKVIDRGLDETLKPFVEQPDEWAIDEKNRKNEEQEALKEELKI